LFTDRRGDRAEYQVDREDFAFHSVYGGAEYDFSDGAYGSVRAVYYFADDLQLDGGLCPAAG